MVESFERSVSGIGCLADPVRNSLYRYVCGQSLPVTREQAAQALAIPRHQAKFHLDRLELEGLLETDYLRVTGRTGPGAGRPTKRYRRARREFAVAVPDRRYELAGQVMAAAIEDSAVSGAPALDALHRSARDVGLRLASSGRADPADTAEPGGRSPTAPPWSAVIEALRQTGFEPRQVGQRVELANCPFHELAQAHTELVCGMTLALLCGMLEAVPTGPTARIDPGPDRCCVVVEPVAADRRRAAHPSSAGGRRGARGTEATAPVHP